MVMVWGISPLNLASHSSYTEKQSSIVVWGNNDRKCTGDSDYNIELMHSSSWLSLEFFIDLRSVGTAMPMI
eukprot:m.101837 g.101837  ORF g.101837 m.101837 type:complete len:71 (-) comp9068_c0_seq3:107-319(-)